MITSSRHRPFKCAVLTVAAFFAAANVALAADDGGVHAFLLNMFGEAGRPAISDAPAPVSASPIPERGRRRVATYRPLTIRPRHERATPRIVAAVGPTKPHNVSIYQDPTLRPGDAVMMADGIRIFSGATSWPYAKTDFIPLQQARDLNRSTVTVLAGLNSLPRS